MLSAPSLSQLPSTGLYAAKLVSLFPMYRSGKQTKGPQRLVGVRDRVIQEALVLPISEWGGRSTTGYGNSGGTLASGNQSALNLIHSYAPSRQGSLEKDIHLHVWDQVDTHLSQHSDRPVKKRVGLQASSTLEASGRWE